MKSPDTFKLHSGSPCTASNLKMIEMLYTLFQIYCMSHTRHVEVQGMVSCFNGLLFWSGMNSGNLCRQVYAFLDTSHDLVMFQENQTGCTLD